ncbi:MAG: type IV secretion system protein, partial [Wolbachia pipientis]|nr:type IV secretion system protein [Wolbachia pipientis]
MRKFLLITTFFLLSSCEDYCIKPKNLLSLHEKLDIVSTQQKWTNSNIHISNEVKVTEIHIVPNKISFCSQYEDIAIRPGTKKITLSKFILKAGDILNFSIVGSKICKDKENKTIRYINIDKKCNNKEKEYFAHILNQNECQTWENKEDQYTICPNKYIIGNKTKWLNGKEYWNPTFSKLDQDERKERIQNIINSIKEKNVNCDNLLKSQINKVDTHILNLLCGYICKFPSSNKNINCAYTEYNNIGETFQPNIEVINNTLKEKQVKTYITFLRVHMDGENFEHIPSSGLCTNCNHKINSNHKTPSLIFSLCSRNDESCFNKNDKGGFNIRVTRVPNLENSLYIRVSNEHPKNNPGENQEDIPIDISKIHDNQEIEKLKKKLKNKRGTIFYGIKDHGCNYENNKGQLNIKLTTKELHIKTFSAIYNFFNEKIKAAFFGSSYYNNQDVTSDISAIKSLYESFLNSSRTNTIRSTIVSLLVLHIILYTFYYLLGLTHVSIYEFLIVCVKIGIITQLLRDNSWNYFYNNAFSIFINTPKQLIEIANFRNTTSNIFEFLDSPLNRFFSSNSILLIISLIFSG